MFTLPAHTAKPPIRHLTAAAMTALYLLVVFSPLAPFVMHSTGTARAAVRECSGDCNICGCSPESRAANTCCCSKKRQQQAHLHDDVEADEPECCKKERAENQKTIIACGCPCGNGKQATLPTVGTSEVIPFHFVESFSRASTDTTFSKPIYRLTTRLGEPPEPPPKLSTLS